MRRKDVSLFSTPQKRGALTATSLAYLLVQLASMPVTLSIPAISTDFQVSVSEGVLMNVAYLAILAGSVVTAARLGDAYGPVKIFFLGMVVFTTAGTLSGFAQGMAQLIGWRAVQGLGAGLVTGNTMAILAHAFPEEQRGRAIAFPITGSRVGTLLGLVTTALFLEFLNWRWLFWSVLPLGALAMAGSIQLIRYPVGGSRAPSSRFTDWTGSALLMLAMGALILAGIAIRGGEELALRSPRPLLVPLGIFAAFAGLFSVVESRSRDPLLRFSWLANRYLSSSLLSNFTYHLSMTGVMVLVPILVERGLSLTPLYAVVLLLPYRGLGLALPAVSGWIYDRHRPRLLRPGALAVVGLGLLSLGLLAGGIPFWWLVVPLLALALGTGLFSAANNAAIMNAVAREQRGFASGMLELTRQLGHTLGAMTSAVSMALILQAAMRHGGSAEPADYVRGFSLAAALVSAVVLSGVVTAFLHQGPSRPTS